jgi:integrase
MMPKIAVPLSDVAIKRAKPAEKRRKLYDGDGLFIEIHPNGNKFWRFRFRQVTGPENVITFGKYPDVSLAEARQKRAAARRLLDEGKDPLQIREDERRAVVAAVQYTFENLAREWLGVKAKSWTEAYARNVLYRLEHDIFPEVGKCAINEVTHRQMIDTLRKIEHRGANEIANRQRAVCSQIFSYAIQSGISTRNPIADMRDVLQRVTPGNFAAIGADDLPSFLDAMRRNESRMNPATRIGLRLMMLTFVRTSELIETPWSEIVEGSDTWTIPWVRMKMGKRRLNPIKKDHVVPLSRQTQALFAEMRLISGAGPFVFPNLRDHDRPMSNNAFLKALERMGYRGKMTGHGFRALAMSTIKERLGYRHEVVDRQLAHVHADKVTKAYDRAEFIEERREMMQAWADYISSLAPGLLVDPHE